MAKNIAILVTLVLERAKLLRRKNLALIQKRPENMTIMANGSVKFAGDDE